MHIISDKFTDLYTYFVNNIEIRACLLVRAVEEPGESKQIKLGDMWCCGRLQVPKKAAVVSPIPYALLQCELATPPPRRVCFLLACIWWAPWLFWPSDYNRHDTVLPRHNLYLAVWNIYSWYALSQNPALGCKKPKSHRRATWKCFSHMQLSSQLTASTNLPVTVLLNSPDSSRKWTPSLWSGCPTWKYLSRDEHSPLNPTYMANLWAK